MLKKVLDGGNSFTIDYWSEAQRSDGETTDGWIPGMSLPSRENPSVSGRLSAPLCFALKSPVLPSAHKLFSRVPKEVLWLSGENRFVGAEGETG